MKIIMKFKILQQMKRLNIHILVHQKDLECLFKFLVDLLFMLGHLEEKLITTNKHKRRTFIRASRLCLFAKRSLQLNLKVKQLFSILIIFVTSNPVIGQIWKYPNLPYGFEHLKNEEGPFYIQI